MHVPDEALEGTATEARAFVEKPLGGAGGRRRRRVPQVDPTDPPGLQERAARLAAAEKPSSLAADFGIEDQHAPEDAEFSVVVPDDRALPPASPDEGELEEGADSATLADALASTRLDAGPGPGPELPDLFDGDDGSDVAEGSKADLFPPEADEGPEDDDRDDDEDADGGGDGLLPRGGGYEPEDDEDYGDGGEDWGSAEETLLEEIRDAEVGPDEHVAVLRLFMHDSITAPVIDLERAVGDFRAKWVSYGADLADGAKLAWKVKYVPRSPLSNEERAAHSNTLGEAPPTPGLGDRAQHAVHWGKYLHGLGRWIVKDAHRKPVRPVKPESVEEKRSPNAPTQKLIRADREVVERRVGSTLCTAAIYVRVKGPAEGAAELDALLNKAKEAFPLHPDAKAGHKAEWRAVEPHEWDPRWMFAAPDPAEEIVLTEDELKAITRLPDGTANAPGSTVKHGQVRMIESSLREVTDPRQPWLDGDDLLPIGIVSPGSHDERVVALEMGVLDRGAYIGGMAGSGKSQLALNLMEGISRIFRLPGKRNPLVFTDPQGETSEKLLQGLAAHNPEALDDFVYLPFNGDDTKDIDDPKAKWTLACNPLDVRTDDIDVALGRAAAVYSLCETHLDIDKKSMPRAYRLMRELLKAFVNANIHIKEDEAKLTLMHATAFLTDAEFREAVMDLCDLQETQMVFGRLGSWAKLAEPAQEDMARPLIGRLTDLNEGMFKHVFSSPTNAFDIVGLVKEGKSIIINLGKQKHSEESSASDDMFATFAAAYFFDQLISRVGEYGHDAVRGKGTGATIVIEEAPLLVHDDKKVPNIWAELRKLWIQLIIITQNSKRMGSTRDEMFDSPATVITFQQGDPGEASKMAGVIDGTGKARITGSDIKALPSYYAYGRTMAKDDEGGVTTEIFSILGLPPIEFPPGTEFPEIEELKERSKRMTCNNSRETAARLRSIPGEDCGDGRIKPPRYQMVEISIGAMQRALIRKEQAEERQAELAEREAADAEERERRAGFGKSSQARLDALRGYSTSPSASTAPRGGGTSGGPSPSALDDDFLDLDEAEAA